MNYKKSFDFRSDSFPEKTNYYHYAMELVSDIKSSIISIKKRRNRVFYKLSALEKSTSDKPGFL